MPIREKNGKTLVLCCRCEAAGVGIKSVDPAVVEEQLLERGWRQAPEQQGEWVCERCQRGGDRRRRRRPPRPRAGMAIRRSDLALESVRALFKQKPDDVSRIN